MECGKHGDTLIYKCKYQHVIAVQEERENFQLGNVGRGRQAYFVEVGAFASSYPRGMGRISMSEIEDGFSRWYLR